MVTLALRNRLQSICLSLDTHLVKFSLYFTPLIIFTSRCGTCFKPPIVFTFHRTLVFLRVLDRPSFTAMFHSCLQGFPSHFRSRRRRKESGATVIVRDNF